MLKKIKDWLGIEGVSVQVDKVELSDLNENEITGEAVLSTKSEQVIDKLIVTVKEKYSRGRRKSKLIDEYVLGKKEIEIHKTLLPEDSIIIPFDIRYEKLKSGMDEFGDRNIFYKGLTKMAKLAKNAKSDYTIVVEAVVTGNALKPYAIAPVDLD